MTEEPRRILMIAPTSFFLDYGCHVRILEETRALLAQGMQVRIVTYTWPRLAGIGHRALQSHAVGRTTRSARRAIRSLSTCCSPGARCKRRSAGGLI